ncbi:putative Zn(2)-C6 fungal-type domain-containing protein [Seiridium cardinale]
MSSPPVRNSRVSRRQEIPANLTTYWQSSVLGGAKPVVRRPKTACERCRTAKVKCHGDGQHECDRCSSRSLVCQYTQEGLSPSLDSPRNRRDPNSNVRDGAQMDLDASPADHLGSNNAATFQDHVDWSNMNEIHPTQSPAQQNGEWDTVNPILGWASEMNPSTSLDHPRSLPSTSTIPPGAATTTTTDHMPKYDDRRYLSGLGLFPLITSNTAAELSWQNQLASQNCQCRTGLTLLIPNARAALQQRQLDLVFKVTGDVVQQCQNIVSCESCSVNCTDLICIMAVFQEADICFEYIAKGDIDRAINVSMGSYEMAVSEQDAKQWRRMLVIQLLRRANELLDTISARGQAMLKSLDPGCRLGRVNIEYLEAVIGNSRENFQHIMRGFRDEAKITS